MITIMIPGLIWPDSADLEYLPIKAPNYDRLIRRSKTQILPYSFSDVIYSQFLNDSNNSDISLAQKMAQDMQIDNEYKYFIFVEPTHLRTDRDRLLISETELLQLDDNETEHLINQLNAHFTPDIKFYKVTTELWLMGVNFTLSDNLFYPIADIIGENIDDYMPKGSNGFKLIQILNEAQMLLFKLELNLKRKQNNLLTINSLWFWDKSITSNPLNAYKEIFSNTTLIKHGHLHNIPNNLNPIKQFESSLIFIDSLYYPARYRDSYAWLNNLELLDKNLFSRLIKYKGIVKFMVPSLKTTLEITISNTDKYKIWRKFLIPENFI